MFDLFAEELRRARNAAGKSQSALGQEISYSAALVCKIENAERRPRRDFARRCDTVLDTGGLLERIYEVMSRDVVLPWFRQWVLIEQEAAALQCYEPLLIPGLLQTEAYARAVLGAGALLTDDEVEQQVSARLDRQQVLSRERPLHFTAVVDEGVLHRTIGGPEVMREQLLHVVKVCAEHPRVRFQVVPPSAGAYVGLNGPFVVASPPEGDDVGFMDTQRQGQAVDSREDVAALRRAWDSIRALALPHPQSIELVLEVAETWS